MAYYFPEIPEPPEDAVIATCTHCNGEIYAGEEYGEDGEDIICRWCMREKGGVCRG